MNAARHPCQDCNLCCDGTLFNRVEVDRAEVAQLADYLALEPFGGGLAFAQPCPASGSDGCACYAERPRICRAFRCTSLTAREAGTIDEAELRRRITTALEARNRLLSLAPDGTELASLRTSLLTKPEAGRDPGLHLALGVLELLLDRYFRKEGRRAMQSR